MGMVKETNPVAESFHVRFRELFALAELGDPGVDFVLHPSWVRCVLEKKLVFLSGRGGGTRSKIGEIGISARHPNLETIAFFASPSLSCLARDTVPFLE